MGGRWHFFGARSVVVGTQFSGKALRQMRRGLDKIGKVTRSGIALGHGHLFNPIQTVVKHNLMERAVGVVITEFVATKTLHGR